MENLKKVIALLGKAGEVTDLALADKKIDLADLPLIMGIFPQLMTLSAIEWTKLDDELATINAENSAELVDAFKTAFVLSNKEMEVKVEAIVSILQKIAALAMELIALVKGTR